MLGYRAILRSVVVGIGLLVAAQKSTADNVMTEWHNVKLPAPPELKPVQVDPARTALLLFDFTTQTCTAERRPRCAANVPKLQKLLGDAKTRGMFVVYSVAGADSSAKDILAPIAPAGSEPVLPALGPDKFLNSDFEKTLKDRGIQAVILTGTAAQTTVLHTGAAAALRGLRVVVPVDGMSSNDAFGELYTAWHLANAARIMNQVTLTTVDMITYR